MNKLKKQMIVGGVFMSLLPASFVIIGTIGSFTSNRAGALVGTIFALFGLGCLMMLWRQLSRNYARMKRMRGQNFDWYRTTYASHVRNGRVACRKCDCDRISVRQLMRHTYMREHVCTQCGETLYYSLEGIATV